MVSNQRRKKFVQAKFLSQRIEERVYTSLYEGRAVYTTSGKIWLLSEVSGAVRAKK